MAIAIAKGYEAYALSFDYGQRHKLELEAARRIANSLGAKEHCVAHIDNRIFAGSALTDDVVACLKDPEFVRRVGADPILGCLACLSGPTEGPADQIHTEWGWQGPLLDGVRAKLKRRYSFDLDRLLSEG